MTYRREAERVLRQVRRSYKERGSVLPALRRTAEPINSRTTIGRTSSAAFMAASTTGARSAAETQAHRLDRRRYSPRPACSRLRHRSSPAHARINQGGFASSRQHPAHQYLSYDTDQNRHRRCDNPRGDGLRDDLQT